MPDKTHGEQLRELKAAVTSLSDRMELVFKSLDRMDARLTGIQAEMTALTVRVALNEQQTAEVKKGLEEGHRWRWSLAGPITAAVLSSLLTALLSWIIYQTRH